MNGLGSWGDFDGTSDEASFKFDEYGFVAGADYRITQDLVLGAAFAYADTDTDFRGPGARGSTLDRKAYTGAVYGSWQRDGWFADGIVSYTGIDYEFDRKIVYPSVNRTARSCVAS